MKTLQKPNSVIQMLLSAPVKLGGYKPSAFNYISQEAGGVVFHTLRRHFAELTEAELELLTRERVDYQGTDDEAMVKALIAAGFLVREDLDETKTYLEVLDTMGLMSKTPAGKTFYKIFTTLECNARCFYCFEPSHAQFPMLPETVDAVYDYIMKTRAKGKTTLYWFGGEPLCNVSAIDTLCSRMAEAGAEFRSMMVTNGSLLNRKMVERAVKLWKLDWVQITLDGMEAEHNKRKRYCDGLENPFATTLENIGYVLDAGIEVHLRLNIDSKNLESVWKLIDLLAERFADAPTLYIYPAMLHEEWFAWKDKQSEETRAGLRREWERMRKYLAELGYLKIKPLSRNLKLKHCMANDEHCAIINADGKLYTCENCDATMIYGDVWKGMEEPERYHRWTRNVQLRDKCTDCTFLPECTPFDLCPTRHSACKRQQNERLLRIILNERMPQTRKNRASQADVPDHIVE